MLGEGGVFGGEIGVDLVGEERKERVHVASREISSWRGRRKQSRS